MDSSGVKFSGGKLVYPPPFGSPGGDYLGELMSYKVETRGRLQSGYVERPKSVQTWGVSIDGRGGRKVRGRSCCKKQDGPGKVRLMRVRTRFTMEGRRSIVLASVL